MIALALANWKVIGAAALFGALGAWLGYASGHALGYSSGWDKGREALAVETQKNLQGINDEASRAQSRIDMCLTDTTCRLSDDGWRIDRVD